MGYHTMIKEEEESEGEEREQISVANEMRENRSKSIDWEREF